MESIQDYDFSGLMTEKGDFSLLLDLHPDAADALCHIGQLAEEIRGSECSLCEVLSLIILMAEKSIKEWAEWKK